MEKQKNSQLELFSQTRDSDGGNTGFVENSFFSHIWDHDKTILVIITIATTSIISFSLGVEKGRKLSLSKNNTRFDLANKEQAPTLPVALSLKRVTGTGQEKKTYTEKETNQDSAEKVKQRELIESYTIQLASYRSRVSAEKEAGLLKKRGLAPLILSKGSYAVLCVGSFSDKITARTGMSELQKKYNDCYIRRL